MLNSGCGLCVEIAHDDKTNRSLWARCKTLEDGDVVVRNEPYALSYIVATPDTPTSWAWGHYFMNFNDAYEYLMKGEI